MIIDLTADYTSLLPQMALLLSPVADWLIKSGFLVLVAIGIGWIFRPILNPASRHLLWLNVLLCLALIPLLSPSGNPTLNQAEANAAYEIITLSFTATEVTGNLSPAGPESADSGYWIQLILSGYLLVSVALLAQILIAALRIQRINQSATPIADLAFIKKLNEKRRQLKITRPVQVKFSDDITSPISFGLFKPVVIFPAVAKGWPERTLTSALLHEMSHIARLDWLSASGGYLLCSLLWINPFAWYALAKLKVEAESASDIAVVDSGITSKDYAEDLLSITRSCKLATGQQLLTQNMLSAQLLKSRVALLLDLPSTTGKPSSFVPSAIVLTSAIVAVWLCAGTFLRASQVHAFNWQKYEFEMKLSEDAFSQNSPYRTTKPNFLTLTDSERSNSYSAPHPLPEAITSQETHLTNSQQLLERAARNNRLKRPADTLFTREQEFTPGLPSPHIARVKLPEAALRAPTPEQPSLSVANLSRSELNAEIRKIETEYFRVFNATEEDESLHVVCGTYRPKGSFITKHFCEPRFMVEARSEIVGEYANLFTMISYPSVPIDENHHKMTDLTAALSNALHENQYLRDLHFYLRELKSAI